MDTAIPAYQHFLDLISNPIVHTLFWAIVGNFAWTAILKVGRETIYKKKFRLNRAQSMYASLYGELSGFVCTNAGCNRRKHDTEKIRRKVEGGIKQ